MSLDALRLLESRAKDRREAAALALKNAQDVHADVVSKQDELRNQLVQPLPAAMSAQLLQMHSAYRGHLTRLALEAEAAVAEAQSRVQRCRTAVVAAGLDESKFTRLITSRLACQEAAAQKREQRETDAQAAQVWFRKQLAV